MYRTISTIRSTAKKKKGSLWTSYKDRTNGVQKMKKCANTMMTDKDEGKKKERKLHSLWISFRSFCAAVAAWEFCLDLATQSCRRTILFNSAQFHS